MKFVEAYRIERGFLYEYPEDEYICLDKEFAVQFAKMLVPLDKAEEYVPDDCIAGWHWKEPKRTDNFEWEREWYCYVVPIKLACRSL